MTVAKRLAQEYMGIASAAHHRAPSRFPATSAMVYWELATDVEMARAQIAMLEARGVEVVHGPKNHDIHHVRLETEDGASCMAVIKSGKAVLYDEEYDAKMRGFNVDMDGVGPRVKDLGVAKKHRLADIVWTRFAGRELPEGYGAVPLNYRPFDVRLDNLIVVKGGGKSNKAMAYRFIPGIDFGMTYVPRNIKVTLSGTSRQEVRVQLPDKERAFSCGPGDMEGLQRCMRQAVEYMATTDPTFTDINARYQECMRVRDAVMTMLCERA
jgi:hypothetical protein